MAQSNPLNLVQVYRIRKKHVRGRPKRHVRQAALQNQGLRVPLWELIRKKLYTWFEMCAYFWFHTLTQTYQDRKPMKTLEAETYTANVRKLKFETVDQPIAPTKFLEASWNQRWTPKWKTTLFVCYEKLPLVGRFMSLGYAIDKKSAKRSRMYTRYMYLPIRDLLCNVDGCNIMFLPLPLTISHPYSKHNGVLFFWRAQMVTWISDTKPENNCRTSHCQAQLLNHVHSSCPTQWSTSFRAFFVRLSFLSCSV